MTAVRLRTVAISIIAVALAVAVAAPSAMAARQDRKGIWGPTRVAGVSQFPLYHSMGVGILQMGLTWSSIVQTRPLQPTNPNDPAYHWDPDIDYALSQAHIYGMRILLQVNRAPAWANGSQAFNNPDRVNPTDLANFVTAAARHYRGVHLWMIFGEPNRADNWIGMPVVQPRSATRLTSAQAFFPRLYAKFVDASYGALKNVSKSNLVIAGDTYTYGYISTRLWMKYMRLPNGKPPRMDLYGHDPFSTRAPNLHDRQNDPANKTVGWEWDFSDLARLYQLVNSQLAPRVRVHHRHHRATTRITRHIKLFISEWCIPTGTGDSEFGFNVNANLAAQWISDAWKIVRSHSFIYALSWIHVIDQAGEGYGSTCGLEYSYGNPKPGLAAWAAG